MLLQTIPPCFSKQHMALQSHYDSHGDATSVHTAEDGVPQMFGRRDCSHSRQVPSETTDEGLEGSSHLIRYFNN